MDKKSAVASGLVGVFIAHYGADVAVHPLDGEVPQPAVVTISTSSTSVGGAIFVNTITDDRIAAVPRERVTIRRSS